MISAHHDGGFSHTSHLKLHDLFYTLLFLQLKMNWWRIGDSVRCFATDPRKAPTADYSAATACTLERKTPTMWWAQTLRWQAPWPSSWLSAKPTEWLHTWTSPTTTWCTQTALQPSPWWSAMLMWIGISIRFWNRFGDVNAPSKEPSTLNIPRVISMEGTRRLICWPDGGGKRPSNGGRAGDVDRRGTVTRLPLIIHIDNRHK